MEWQDQGYVLAARRYGEGDAIVALLTSSHGRHLGLVKGGASRSNRSMMEAGTLVAARWRARLSEQLGHFQFEPIYLYSALFLEKPARLAALTTACTLLDATLPERDPQPAMFERLSYLIERMKTDEKEWPKEYVLWEVVLLAHLGFGLDLSRCAVTGATSDLTFVSPRTGRAVTKEAALGYEERLLRLPKFLLDANENVTRQDIAAGLQLTGHFLKIHVFDRIALNELAETRARLVRRLSR